MEERQFLQPVYDEQQNLLINEQGVLCYSVKDQSLTYVNMQTAQALFKMPVLETVVYTLSKEQSPQIPEESPSDCSTTSSSTTGEDRNPWSRLDVLKLIGLYEEHQHLFKSSTTRNDKIWGMISKKITTHSADQCKNKFFYLKGKYTKQKDNMSTKSTGGSKITFAYFDEMDRIFGHEPNITPVLIASSSSQTQMEVTPNNANENNENTEETQRNKDPPEPLKKGNKKFEEIKNLIVKQQQGAERRHRENMAKKDEAIDAVRELVATLKQQQTEHK